MSTTISNYPLQPPPIQPVPGDEQNNPGQAQHKRVYQACIPCRRRKVKCDLGSVDNPSDPPCVRCRRESKECYFSATRRKRKAEDDGIADSADGHEVEDEYTVRNGRKRLHSESGSDGVVRLPPSLGMSSSMGRYLDESMQVPTTPGGNAGRLQPLARPNSHQDSRYTNQPLEDSNVRYENPEAQTVMSKQVFGPHDALDLLYKAATDSPGHDHHMEINSIVDPPPSRRGPMSPQQRRSIPRSNPIPSKTQRMAPPSARREVKIDPNLTSEPPNPNRGNKMDDPGYKEAIKAWSRFRFVRAGWFTAQEAIEYLEYYYDYLSPLTPISPPTFSNPETHPTLLTEEPILTVTLLTMASRYKMITGPGGICRSHAVHEQLWTYLRGMIERCLWGQEAFGGGFCGSGSIEGENSSNTAPWRGLRRGSLRTLGTIEALMILTEWHPRALHFPPQDATDELMLPSYDGPDHSSVDENGNRRATGGYGGKRIESWLEPAWRSDRMCWMLLSNALGLSYELGVFDDIDDSSSEGGMTERPEYADENYRLRAMRIKKLVLIYMTQLAGRLAWTNMVPNAFKKAQAGMEQNLRKKQRSSIDGNTPGTTSTISSTAFNYIPDLEMDDQIIHCWAGIANTMRLGNERIFRSRKHTTDIIRNGQYVMILKEFQPMLKNWLQTFESFRLPTYIRHILTIEYEYVRIYINSLALQAVCERGASHDPEKLSTVTNGNSALSPQTARYIYANAPLTTFGGLGSDDQLYVKEVMDGSRNLLRTVVDGLLPDNYLKHAPVRTYFRIISGAMFLLKTFVLGASREDIRVSFSLMDRAVSALRDCVVDDVHLGTRFADLLDSLTRRLRHKFLRNVPSATAPVSRRGSPQPQGEPRISAEQVQSGAQDAHTTMAEPQPGWHDPNANIFPEFDGNIGLDITATAFDMPSAFPGANSFPYGENTNPGNGFDNSGFNNGAANGQGVGWEDEMFWLPLGEAFFHNSGQDVTQTAEGVNVGGLDLLDFMAMDNGYGTGMNGQGGTGF